MNAHNRIVTVVDAVKIFMRSLPNGSSFSIISFGSESCFMEINGLNVVPYNQANAKAAIEELDKFDAMMGGTEMIGPITKAKELNWPG